MTPGGEEMLAKAAAGMLVPMLTIVPFDLWWLLFVPLGLMAGWLARAARLVERQRPWGEVRRDLIVSVLAGASNGIVAALLIWLGELNYLQGIGVACVCAFLGTGTLERAARWAIRKVAGEIDEKDREIGR